LLKSVHKTRGYERTSIYTGFINPMLREGLLQPQNYDLNIDIKEEMKDKDTITVLCLDFVDKEYRLFILGYLLRKMSEYLDKKSGKSKTVGIIREASEFFRATDQAVVHDRYKIFRVKLSQWIRMGRRGMHLLMDAQSPNETRGMVEGQQDLTLLGRLPSERDRAEAVDQLRRDNLITSKLIGKIGILNPGEFVICPSGKKAFYQYILLPKTRYWKEGDGNFYISLWKKEVDRWTDFTNDIEKSREQHKIAWKEWKEWKKTQKAIKNAEKRVKRQDDYKAKQELNKEANVVKIKPESIETESIIVEEPSLIKFNNDEVLDELL